jgi:hypothetical protein
MLPGKSPGPAFPFSPRLQVRMRQPPITHTNPAARLLPLAREVQRSEQIALERMRRGESLFDMLNYDEHEAATRAHQESRLKFR